MITVITGLTGSGKTWYATRLIHREWKKGAKLWLNYAVNFNEDNTDVERWHNLDELYGLTQGIIGIDEGQKLFDARRWFSLPISFAEKIASHRHDGIDIYTTTQDLGDIDKRIRTNIHELFNATSLFRWPKNDRIRPALQLIRIVKKKRIIKESERLTWRIVGWPKFYFISRFWTRELYNTYANIRFDRYICKFKYEKKANQKKAEWSGKIYSRELVNSGKARI